MNRKKKVEVASDADINKISIKKIHEKVKFLIFN